MNSVFRPALVLFGALTLVTGVAYPLVVTGIAKEIGRASCRERVFNWV